MQINRAQIRQLLRDFEFKTLLIEELGWNRHRGEVAAEIRETGGDESGYLLTAIAEKRGMAVFQCSARSDGSIPDYATRRKIQREVAKSVHEHLIIYTDAAQTTQIWQWVKREPGKPLACREHRYGQEQSGEALIQRLETIAFSLDEEDDLTLPDVTGRVRAAFDMERVTKRFYDRFKTEHNQFLNFLEGIPDQEMERWYASVMLNRLMFIYFIQKKGFLNDDPNYLQTKLEESQCNGDDRYYTGFLCPLFFEGFAKPESERRREVKRLLGKVPYLNGGIFQRHQIEELHGIPPCQGGQGGSIQITDAAFEKLFDFFEAYQWHLDERPLRNDNEINPDVLGYIFEKYINQKEMGAYYTKEDITEYISKNTIIPSLFDTARKGCRIAFEGEASVWQLLQSDPDRYIYDAVKTGVQLDVPEDIAAGIHDVSKRGPWNTPAPDEYALPTETWRETVARRERYESIHAKLLNGEIDDINALITYNLDIRQFAQDVIADCEGPELLRAFWKAITEITILDPTCGSGAFLFAALNILEPLYEACLDRMEVFLEELEHTREKPRTERFRDFRKVLEDIDQHPNRRYFILKSIIINNLYGVDIMEEAIEICKLRLFLKMVAQIEDVRQIEPLPDIDFNVQAGNTLVGYATYDEVENAIIGKLDFDNAINRIKESAEDVEQLFEQFRLQQTELGGIVEPDDKQELRDKLKALEDELNRYLADEYKVDPNKASAYQKWLSSHKPFHWFIEFYGILKDGGFDVIIGNPPYVEYSKVKKDYRIRGYAIEDCGNLYTFVMERSQSIQKVHSRLGLIVPISLTAAQRMKPLQRQLLNKADIIHFSNFALRPAALFPGVMQRLTICLMCSGNIGSAYTTDYTTWYADERPELFHLLKYTSLNGIVQEYSLPKVNTLVSRSALLQILDSGHDLHSSRDFRGNFTIFYHNAGGYWIKTFNFRPYYRSLTDPEKKHTTISELHLPSNDLATTYLCILNSSLFYFFWKSLTDARHIYPSDIAMLPVRLPLPQQLLDKFYGLEEKLMNAYQQNSTRIIYGKAEVDQFSVAPCKPIIDEIDCVLAQHYGFTNEELDFIINYDIKYRMGLGS